jgi:TetR/AcrR family transcriptional regulator, cholesterol catabolism regulator
MTTVKTPGDEMVTPLSAVLAALRRARERGELSDNEITWSVNRLSGRIRPGNPGVKGLDRRESILQASAQIFQRRGYHHTTIEEVAAELFLTKAGVYHYFASKQQILEAICTRAIDAAETAVGIGMRAAGGPDARLRRMLDEYTDVLMREPAFSVNMNNLQEVSASVLVELERRRKVIESMFREVLDEGVRAGVFEVPDTRVTVFGMLGALNWIYSWYAREGRLRPEEVREILVNLLMNGVRARQLRRAAV